MSTDLRTTVAELQGGERVIITHTGTRPNVTRGIVTRETDRDVLWCSKVLVRDEWGCPGVGIAKLSVLTDAGSAS